MVQFDENIRKFLRQVENNVGKGEIAHYKQFLLFLQCFKRLVLQTCKNQGVFGKGLMKVICMISVFRISPINMWKLVILIARLLVVMVDLTLYCTMMTFDDPWDLFENIVGKGENAGYQHILLFPQFVPP